MDEEEGKEMKQVNSISSFEPRQLKAFCAAPTTLHHVRKEI
jgi:hypothetical protein